MDEYDVFLNEMNRERKTRKLKKFFRGKKWNKKQRAELEKQGKPPLQINTIGGLELQRKHMREGLSDTEGMTITEESAKKLMSDLSRGKPIKGGIDLDGVFYEDFSLFSSHLINKYFTRED